MMRALFTSLLMLASHDILAQAAAAPVPAPLSAKLERAKAELAAEPALDESTKKSLEALLERARSNDVEADRLLEETRRAADPASSPAAQVARAERDLHANGSQDVDRWRDTLPSRAARDQLTRIRDEVQAAASQTQAQLAGINAELSALAARPATIGDELTRLGEQLEKLRGVRDPARDATGEALRPRIEALARQAEQRFLLASLAHLQSERTHLSDSRRLLEIRQQSLRADRMLQDQKSEVLEAMLAERTGAELDELQQRLQRERDEIDATEPMLVEAADANVALGTELAEASDAARATSDDARQAQRDGTTTVDALRNTRARLALGSDDDTVGLILLSESRRLQEPDQIADELSRIRRELARVQLRLIDLDEQRDAQDDPDQAVRAALRDVEDTSAETQSRLRDGFEVLIATRGELLPKLESALRDRQDALVQLERALLQRHAATQELSRILQRELLWIPSHEPVGFDWLRRQASAWMDLFKPSRYVTSTSLVLSAAQQRWPLAVLSLSAFLALLVFRRSVPRRFDQISQPMTRVRTDRYVYTARALLLTVLAALPWPLLLTALGWFLQRAGESGKFSDSLGRSLMALSGGVLVWQAMRWLVRERGLGHLHFRWTLARRNAIRATLPWLAFGLLPLQLLLTLAFVRGQEPAVDAAARIMLLAFCGLGGWVAWRLLAPGALWTPRGAPRIEPARLRQLLRLGVPGLLLLLSALALNGYVLTAGIMLRCLWWSVGAILAVAVLHGMISRWILLGERRLALKRLEHKREAEAAGGSDRTGSTGDAMLEQEPEELTLESVGAHTRRLLRAVLVVALALTLLWVWSGLLPALARLDEIRLWQFATLDANGNAIADWVTLRAFLFGLGVLVLTVIAARNLPGLVELGLLTRINLDSPTRYAITSISRYIIVLGGMVLGLGLLGLRWGQLQWMAAALTVGLGFGLQEIFANFVSGLIVLFERPYRVGDIITIGEVEGTVTRIRTRATTVLDWDNKEVVVPNKTFITERFVNWTLSDAVTRVVLKIGVAYASDPAQVQDMLLQAADEEEMVLKQPMPTCWLVALGNSTLDFELRVFVGAIIDRNRARNALFQRIVTHFREHGIEIAFPQMDLWVRSPLPGTPAADDAVTAPAPGAGQSPAS